MILLNHNLKAKSEFYRLFFSTFLFIIIYNKTVLSMCTETKILESKELFLHHLLYTIRAFY